MTTFHDPPPSRRAARQSERERASDEQTAVEDFTKFPAQDDAENRIEEAQANPSAAPTASATPPADAAADAPAAFSSPVMPPAPVAPRPSTDAAYRTAPPPAPHTQNSLFAPLLPPPSDDPVAPREPDAAEPTLTRRELRELRARQDAELAGGEPEATNPNADAVPLVSDYMEPPALIDPLSVVPEAAAISAPREDALSAFESLIANADGSAKDADVEDAPRSPLAGLPGDDDSAELGAEFLFGDLSSSASTEDPFAPAAPAVAVEPAPASGESRTKKARAKIAGLLRLNSDTSSDAPEATSEAPEASDNAPEATNEVLEVSDDEPETTDADGATNLSNARAEFDEQARKRLDGELPAVFNPQLLFPDAEAATVAPTVALSPAPSADASAVNLGTTDHWSRQAAIEDKPSDGVVARTVSSGTSTTSALVLPAIPFATDIRGPLNSSGKTMLTGSIDLPTTLSASGVSDRFDNADIDSLLDLNDSDIVSTDSAPVRAVQAVSTFSNQAVTQTQKPKGTRALTVLLISASSMAVVVAGLLVAAFAFNML